MSTTIGCPIPGASQPKEPVRLIDADEVMNAVFNAIDIDEKQWNEIKQEVDEIPTINPESLRPTAHWISDSCGSTNVVCSACNAISFAAYNFFPECGKRMVTANE